MSVCSAMPYAAARRDFMLGAFPAKLRQCRAQGTHTLHVAQRKPDPVQCLSDQHSELVSIDEISEQEIDATADLLATAFSEAINRINYKRFLEKEIRQYLLTSTTDLSDDCIIFVAKARQTGTEDKRIVGTGMVSFNVKSRSQFMTCRPPPSALFLTNMAVSREYQRQGIASQILKACEDYCRTHRPERIMCLQVRWKDAPARKLYQKFEYHTMKRDWRIVSVFKEPQELLAKDLAAT